MLAARFLERARYDKDMNYCPNCGAQAQPNTSGCSRCGRAYVASAPQAPTVVSQLLNPLRASHYQAELMSYMERNGVDTAPMRRKVATFQLIGLAVVFAGLGYIVFGMLR